MRPFNEILKAIEKNEQTLVTLDLSGRSIGNNGVADIANFRTSKEAPGTKT